MALLDLVVSKSVTAAMANNLPLSRITSTTLGEVGTSISGISSTATDNSMKALAATGITDNSVLKPINDMKTMASQLDPGNAATYSASADSVVKGIQYDISSALPGVNNSVFDIQKVSTDALSNGVAKYSSQIGNIAPNIVGSVTTAGFNALPGAKDLLSKGVASAFNVASGSLTKSVSDISKSLADKASAASTASALKAINDTPIKGLPDTAAAGTTTGAATAATFTVSHDPIGATTVSEDLSTKAPKGSNTTDVIYQQVKIYVEGVQIPFEACSITQSIGNFPQATFQVPPQAGLMDIARYYQPKVHIFYTDLNTGGDRVLFNGHIIACNYSHSQQNSSISISFECVHKNALMKQLTFEWSAGGSSHATSGANFLDNNPMQATVQVNNVNSEASLLLALQGLTGVQSAPADLIDPSNTNISDEAIRKLDKKLAEFEKRLIGMPSAMVNIWNQVKKTVFANPSLNVIFTKVYLPLLEDGIQFFSRTSGHYYLEKIINDTKTDHCNDNSRPELSQKVMLPPAFRMNIMSAIQVQMVVNNLNSMLGFSGELMNFHDLFMNFYYGVEYEMLTLSSPAEVPCDPTVNIDPDNSQVFMAQNRMAVETIIKPQIPFYYSPICNVILPNMYNSLQVTQMEADIPSRITATSNASGQAVNGSNALGLNYRAPQSIRESVALGRTILDNGNSTQAPATLRETTGSSYNLPGKYELGRGVSHRKITMPPWLSHIASDGNENRAVKNDEASVVAGSLDDKALKDLEAAWEDRYGSEASRKNLNPYSKSADVMAYERLLFAAADYEFTKDVVKSKTGGVDCLFNPYIVPGYPMDILNKNPNHPSFHGMCSSVTHSISSRSISTSVGFMAAITYTEMYNYFIQPIHPWLQTALKMINVARDSTTASTAKADPTLLDDTDIPGSKLLLNNSDYVKPVTATPAGTDPLYDTNTGDVSDVNQSLVGNTRAKLVADEFYKSVFGVGAAEPSQMYDFDTGEILAVSRSNGIWVEPEGVASTTTKNGGEGNDNLTGVGGLRLVSRQIEGRKGIEDRFDLKFIDMTPSNYDGTPAKYTNDGITNSTLLEPGASLFLDYEEIKDFIEDIASSTKKIG
jgi:hypothetical protein